MVQVFRWGQYTISKKTKNKIFFSTPQWIYEKTKRMIIMLMKFST